MSAIDRLLFLSKLYAAIHCDSHYHRQRSFITSKKLRQHGQEIPQPHTADELTALCGRATEQ